MTPGELGEAAKLYELLAKVFGTGAAPAILAWWIWSSSRKREADPGAGIVGELRDDVKAIRGDMADMKVRMAVVETKLEERKDGS